MNTCNNINVPNQTVFYDYVLNRQSHNEYLLNNLTRVAIIYNYINGRKRKSNEDDLIVDTIFDRFCSITDPSSIPKFFLANFETFMHIYLLERFGKMYNIFISEAEIENILFPIHAFCSENNVIVLYKAKDLKFLVERIGLLHYLYFNDKYFLMPRNGCADEESVRKSFLFDRNDRLNAEKTELEKTISEIQRTGIFNMEAKTNFNPGLNSYCNNLNIHQQRTTNTLQYTKNVDRPKLPPPHNLRDPRNNSSNESSTGGDRNKPSDTFLQIQSNFASIWSAANHVHLTYLLMITQILETAIRPILCSTVVNTVDQNLTSSSRPNKDKLYKDFIESFTHSVKIDLRAYINTKENRAGDYIYTNLTDL